MLKIYNTLTKQKDVFKPVVPNTVSIYLCGITVYDYCHIGHARAIIAFDCIVRYLRMRGYTVNYVHNITDIDDKIINRANENKESVDALTERFIDAMHEDEIALHIDRPTHEPRATQYMPQIIELIQSIIDNGQGYVADNGDVNFAVRKFEGYGKLSGRDLDQLISGARVETAESKHDPLDFVLWKLSKPGEPEWDSPWGKGRPGWHIECSAMSTALLGQPFDIHGGGMDLKFPHHENEVAQSEAGMQKPFAHVWMHVGLLTINDEKMSKSLNNFFTIREVLEDYDAEVIRYFMMASHYRSPVNYSKDNLTKMRHSLERLYTAIRGLPNVDEEDPQDFEAKFFDAMDDDFNTPGALSVLFEMVKAINVLREKNELVQAAKMANTLKRLAGVIGILQQDPETYLKGDVGADEGDKIDALIAARNQARADKDWAAADKVRAQLSEMGVVIEDGADGTTWKRV